MSIMAPLPAADPTSIMSLNTIGTSEEFTTGVKMAWLDTTDKIRPGAYGTLFVILITGGNSNDDMICKMYPCVEGLTTLGTVALPGRDTDEADSFVMVCNADDPYQKSYFVPWDLAPAGLCLGLAATGATDTLIVSVTYQPYRIGNPPGR